jgi:hypothetical protein
MKKLAFFLGISVMCVVLPGGSVLAQSPAEPSASPTPGAQPVPPPAVDIGPVILEWVPPALAQLSSQAVARENFTLDRTMLAAAAGLMPDADDQFKQAVAKLQGVSVHMLRFSGPNSADPVQIEAIRQAYHLRGWKHLITSSNAGGPVHDNVTDVWVVMDGANLRGAVVLVNTPNSLTLATVAGNLNPVDLLHLRGRFGIPNFEGDGLTGQGK